MPDEPLLHLESITKSFGAVRALENVTLEVRRAEILGLCGDNGAENPPSSRSSRASYRRTPG